MTQYPQIIQQLIQHLAKLPTIGPKTAERIIFTLLKKNQQDIISLGQKLIELGQQIKRCSVCHNFSGSDPCIICSDQTRQKNILCIVSEPQDLEAIERTGQFHGLYFVLNGTISTSNGNGPKEINAHLLLQRIKSSPQKIEEVILAFNPDIEGETTVMYLARALKPLGIKTSRLARGLPVGADLEYADEITLSAALNNRNEI